MTKKDFSELSNREKGKRERDKGSYGHSMGMPCVCVSVD